jgi:hypothetical protein
MEQRTTPDDYHAKLRTPSRAFIDHFIAVIYAPRVLIVRAALPARSPSQIASSA